MRVGFIGHPRNLFALDAVLADLQQQEVDSVICLGDIRFGPQADDCLARVRELGCPVILGNWDSWSIDGFPPADDPVGIMLYEIGRWWAGPADRRRQGVRAHVRADARGAARPWVAGVLLPRLAALVLGLDLRHDARRRRREDVRRPAAALLSAGTRTCRCCGVRPVDHRQPGQRRPAVQPVVAEGDPRRALGRVRRDRHPRRPRPDRPAARAVRRGRAARLAARERHAALLVVDRLLERLVRRSSGR